ncbi:hypothetical protein ACFWBF_11230 [Streptomyces sp. NPDC060028]|uniref:hypothetical protein n=1 Tax=Streptomyces sp. NPDC060028 TaxID=3347041 RepID=UPI003683426C
MNRRVSLAVLAPVMVSSLALGSVAFLGEPAQSAVPSASCSVSQNPQKPDGFDVKGEGFTPGERVVIQAQNGEGLRLTATADGTVSIAGIPKEASPFTMKQGDGPKITCGTVKEAEQKGAQDEYRKGYRQGVADTKADCKAEPPKHGLAPLDPNYEKGYNAGAAAALAQFCK